MKIKRVSQRVNLHLLRSLPQDSDGYNYWYWSLELTPIGYRCVIWRADGDAWRMGIKYQGEAAVLEDAISLDYEKIPKEKLG